jgi:hypothetical protein
MPLQQDAEIFAAQGILSSGPATDVKVSVHLPVDILKKVRQLWACHMLPVNQRDKPYPSHLFSGIGVRELLSQDAVYLV